MPDIYELTKGLIKPKEELHEINLRNNINIKPEGKEPDFSYFFSEKANIKLDDTEADSTRLSNGYEITQRNLEILNNLASYTQKDFASLPDNEIKKAIINHECFEQSVLITTPVIDSGVNICDENVKNIAIFYTDRTQFIQSLGRKRLKEGENGINVWAFVPSEKSFNERVKRYNKAP